MSWASPAITRLTRARCAGAALVAAIASGLVAVGSCTTFDGLSAAPAPAAGGGASDAAVPQLGYLTTAEAVTACSWVFSCPKLPRSIGESIAVPVDSTNFSMCVDWFAGPIDPGRIGFASQASVLKCIAQSKSCAQAGHCVSFEWISPSDPRCAEAGVPDAGTYAEFCGDDGGSILYCSPKYDGLVVHCKGVYFDPKSKCMLGSSGSYACALDETCPSVTCDSTFFYDTCSANNDLHMRVNCSATGHTCGQSDAGLVGCITGNEFEDCNLYAVKCVDNRVRVCDAYYQSYFDCAARGGTCAAKTGAMPRCTRLLELCDPSDANAVQCTGSKISLCVGGTAVAFDCASVGLTCKPGNPPLTASCGAP